MLIYGTIIIIFMSLFLISKNEIIESQTIPQYLKPFYKVASYMGVDRIFMSEYFTTIKLKSMLQLLYPKQKIELLIKSFYYEKFAMLLGVLFLGTVFAFMMTINPPSILIDNSIIERNSVLEGGEEISLVINDQEEISFWVSPTEYTKEELEALYLQFLPLAIEQLLGDNNQISEVRNNLHYIESIAGYPFLISWTSTDRDEINYTGELQSENIQASGNQIEVVATISYGEFQKKENIAITVFPPAYTETEIFIKQVQDTLVLEDQKTKYEENLILPYRVEDVEISWKDIKSWDDVYLFLLFLGGAIILFFQKDQELKDKIKVRDAELLWEYPTIISKLTLYLSAGMTVKGAWINVLKNGNLQHSEKVYAEMQMTCYEMDCGVAEVQAYEKFGKRCGLQPYIKLTALLVQNIEKGNSILLQRLKEETQLAFIDRKNKTKMKAEEASTKLLLPMMMLMVMVMIMIMVPAFEQF